MSRRIGRGSGRRPGTPMSEEQKRLLSEMRRNKIPSREKRIATRRVALHALVKQKLITKEQAVAQLQEFTANLK